MVNFDTPIHVNDQNWQKVLSQKLPILLYLSNQPNAPLDEALKHAASENVGQLLVVRANANENPQIYARYDRPALPALLAIKDGQMQSVAAPARAADVTAHSAYLLGKAPKPAPKPAPTPSATGSAAPRAGQPMPVSDSTFQRDVLDSDLPVLVDFWAPWCGPCHMIAPVVEQLAQKYSGRLKVVKLNVDENPRTASQYQTMSIPTLILFKNKRVAGRLVGAQPGTAIEQMITSAL